MVNFYRKFISGAALLLCPLTDALEVFSQSPKMASAFSITKAALASVPALVHSDPSAKISLEVDASDSHGGVVFQLLVCGSWAPLTFFSRKLSSEESRYSAWTMNS